MQPFARRDVELIQRTLIARKALRDFALLCMGLDSMLRGGDLVRLMVRDVRDSNGAMRDEVLVRQGKTQTNVEVYPTEDTQAALAAWITVSGKLSDDYVFTRDGAPHGKHLSEVALRNLVKEWAKIAHLDVDRFSGHSLRRTKPSIIYGETNNIETVRQLLGHASATATSAYLNIGKTEVKATARKFNILR